MDEERGLLRRNELMCTSRWLVSSGYFLFFSSWLVGYVYECVRECVFVFYGKSLL